MSITEQMVLNKNGNPVAVQIPLVQYNKMLAMVEEMEEIRAYDRAMKRKPKLIPFNQAVKELKAQRKKK